MAGLLPLGAVELNAYVYREQRTSEDFLLNDRFRGATRPICRLDRVGTPSSRRRAAVIELLTRCATSCDRCTSDSCLSKLALVAWHIDRLAAGSVSRAAASDRPQPLQPGPPPHSV